jgi:mono/diheme cytochrome c family protein
MKFPYRDVPNLGISRVVGSPASRWGVVLALASLLVLNDTLPIEAAPTSRQRSTINTLKRKATRVEEYCRQQDFDAAADEYREIHSQFDRMLADAKEEPDLIPLLEPLYRQMIRVHARLELEGWSLEAPTNPQAATSPSGEGSVSFQGEVAGILVAKCGRCHVSESRGGFQMASFAGLMRGSEAGIVLVPGDADGSRLIEVIESGDMPRGGLRVTAEEMETLKAWIAEGAQFDGETPETPLMEMSSASSSADARLEVIAPSGRETVRFAGDIAPVLARHCTGCHGDGQQASGNLNLTTFNNLLRGGENGLLFVPGDPSESLLIHKLRGTGDGERMPRRQPPLDEETIALFETWIAERGTFDGRDPGTHLAEIAAYDKALHASHEELRADREELARRNWRLSFPGLEPTEARTNHFFLLGNVGERTLADIAERAEKVVPDVAGLLKIPAGRPVVHGSMTLYVLSGRYDYSEFAKMIEQRQLPPSWRGHWRHDVIDSYAVVVVGGGSEAEEDVLLTQLIAANHLAGLGPNTPHWFAEGAARMAVGRIAPRDPRIAEWDRQTPDLLRGMSKPDELFANRLSPDMADLAAYRFVRFIAQRDARRFQTLLKSLREGEPFSEAFQAAYQTTPEQLAPGWIQADARGVRRR